jgi:Ni/Fe-hydrogenase subunit HybB-like protein
LFWYIGMVPDLAALRDRARTRLAGRTYGFLAMGWRGDAEHWDRYERAYLLLAGLAAPLVVSVHTITAFDFAASILPGWHSTLLAPYFVAAAIFSGFAMVIVLAIPIRAAYRLYAYITDRHLQNLGKILLATGLMVGYSYIVENFTAWYSGNHHEMSVALDRVLGPFAGLYWAMVILNVGVPQLLWFGRVRSSPVLLWLIGVVVLIGMWLDRYVIIISSLQRDFLPSSWGPYSPTIWDWGLYIGTFGLFFTLLFLFLRFLPLISIFEVRAQLPQAEVRPGEPSCP